MRVKGLSRGERAGLCLALTLAPDPELLLLEDPGVGLDPVAHRSLVEPMVYLTLRADRTIFFAPVGGCRAGGGLYRDFGL